MYPDLLGVACKCSQTNDNQLCLGQQQNKDNCELRIVKGGFHEMHNEVPPYKDEFFDYLKSSLS